MVILLHVDTAEHAFNKCNSCLNYKIPQKCELVIEQLKPGGERETGASVRSQMSQNSSPPLTLHQTNDEMITVCSNIVAK